MTDTKTHSQNPAAALSEGLRKKREEFRKRQFTLKGFFEELAVGTFLVSLALCFIEISSQIPVVGRHLAVAGYTAVILFVSMLLIGMLEDESSEEKAAEADANPPDSPEINAESVEWDFTMTLAGAVIFLVSFSQICRHLYLFDTGRFQADQAGYWHWLRYGVAGLLQGVLFDIPEVYHWDISEIRPQTFWTRAMLVLYRTALQLLVLAGVLRYGGAAWRYLHWPQAKRHDNYWSHMAHHAGRLIVSAFWIIPLSTFVGAIFADGLSWRIFWLSFATVAPIVFGIWLAWQSLPGLKMNGAWNVFFALTGIVFGILISFWGLRPLFEPLGN